MATIVQSSAKTALGPSLLLFSPPPPPSSSSILPPLHHPHSFFNSVNLRTIARCRIIKRNRVPDPLIAHLLASRRGCWHRSLSLVLCRAQPDADDQPAAKSPALEHSAVGSWPTVVAQVALWILAGVYVFWLFLLPNAPGDPVWAIKPYTILMLIDLSLNFFYILPLTNAVGIHLIEAPVIHPTAEALFNFVIGWTLMFAPLLFTDKQRDRFGGSLEILWSIQMFFTNIVLIPYMAIRLNQASKKQSLSPQSDQIKLDLSGVRSVMTTGAFAVGVVGGMVGLVSLAWFLIGRADEGFGGFSDRWSFFLEYLSNDRIGYAFVWDICLYSIFQPWLIGDNLSNLQKDKIEIVRALRFVPYLGLVAYLCCLSRREE